MSHVQYVDLFPAVVSAGARPVSESPLRRLLRSPRRVYLLEAVVCFGPLVILLGLGLLQLPLVFAEDQPQGAAWLFSGLLLGGFCGLWGVSQLVLRVIQPQRQVGSPRAIVLMLLLGIGCLLGFYWRWQLSPSATLMLIVLPLLGSAHFLFLARDYLVRRPRA